MGIDQTPKFDDAHKTETVMLLLEQGRTLKQQGLLEEAREKFDDAWTHAGSEGPDHLRKYVEDERKKIGFPNPDIELPKIETLE